MKLNIDRVVAILSLIVFVLTAALDAPTALGLSPRMVTIGGGLLVALSATARSLVRLGSASDPKATLDPRDLIGIALGVISLVLGIDGGALDEIDVDKLVGTSSLAAAAFAWHRGGGGTPTPPATTGLVLLVCCACTQQPVKPRSCSAWAMDNARGPMSDIDPELFKALREACEEERKREAVQ